jgi:hypothetical protein
MKECGETDGVPQVTMHLQTFSYGWLPLVLQHVVWAFHWSEWMIVPGFTTRCMSFPLIWMDDCPWFYNTMYELSTDLNGWNQGQSSIQINGKLIQRVVKPGTIIHSDQWKAHATCCKTRYNHPFRSVESSYNVGFTTRCIIGKRVAASLLSTVSM